MAQHRAVSALVWAAFLLVPVFAAAQTQSPVSVPSPGSSASPSQESVRTYGPDYAQVPDLCPGGSTSPQPSPVQPGNPGGAPLGNASSPASAPASTTPASFPSPARAEPPEWGINVVRGETAGAQEIEMHPLDAAGAPAGDVLRFGYDSGHGRIRFAFASSPNAPSRVMEVFVDGVSEFEDTNGNGPQTSGEPVPKAYRIDHPLLHFARSQWSSCGVRMRWTYLLELDAAEYDAIPDKDLAVRLAEEPRLILQFTHLLVPTTSDGGQVVPERVKIDIAVEKFRFTRPGTLLAVPVRLYSLDDLSPLGSDRVESTLGEVTLGFTWAKTALVDGTMREIGVASRIVPSHDAGALADSAYEVNFVYPAGASILHDPELGVLEGLGRAVRAIADSIARGDWAGYLVGLGLAAVLLAGLAASRRRFE